MERLLVGQRSANTHDELNTIRSENVCKNERKLDKIGNNIMENRLNSVHLMLYRYTNYD